MKHTLFIAALIVNTIAGTHVQAASTGGAGSGAAANVNPGNGQTIVPGGQRAQPFAPAATGRETGQRVPIEPLPGNGPSGIPNTNGLLIVTNEFGVLTNQLLLQTNQFTFLTNQPESPASAPGTNTRRVFPSDAAVPPSVAAGVIQDRAQTPSDRALVVQLHRAVMSTLRSSTPIAPVHFQAQEGVVTIIGSVPTLEQKQRIISIAQGSPGVRQVLDQLDVNPLPGAPSSTTGLVPITNQFGLVISNTPAR